VVFYVVNEKQTYIYSNHAKYQMRERIITEVEIKECLADHDTLFADKKGNPVYRARLANGRGIKVVVAKDDPTFIITVADY